MRKESEARRAAAVYKILKEETDRSHPMPMPVLLAALEEYGIHAERRSIYHVLAILQEFGAEIHYSHAGWWLEPAFTPGEILVLTDLVEDSLSLSKEDTRRLADKLQHLLSAPSRHGLPLNPPAAGKEESDDLFAKIDLLMEACRHLYPVEFAYADRTPQGTRVYRHNGRRYRGVPYTLAFTEGRAYVVLYSRKHRGFANYRIDKMAEIQPGRKETEPVPFEREAWLARSFRMYAGPNEMITLHCQRSLFPQLYDAFGENLLVSAVDGETFTAHVRMALSPALTSFLLQFTDRCQILGPPALIQDLKRIAHDLETTYNEGEKEQQPCPKT
jgi:predicted DNA-binding transcriptional regulator YafY